LSCRTVALILCTALVYSSAAVAAGNLSGDAYISIRKLLRAPSPELSVLKANLAQHIGNVVEFRGTVNGIARCGESVSFILNCNGESLLIKSPSPLPECISNGNTIRALVRIGPESIASLSDLQLEGAAYEYDVSKREQQLAPKPKAQAQQKPAAPSRDSNPKTFLSARQARGVPLSSRAMQVYDPYRSAVARLNPKLTSQQVDTITLSILVFSERYQVDPRLVVALFIVESGFKPTATSPKGAMGLGQLMPGTAQGLGVSNAYDPVQNVEASVRLIRGHLDKYGDLALALSAYNAGPGAVKKYGGVPPYRETRNYIRKVASIYNALCGK
jgi:hypothetical protein